METEAFLLANITLFQGLSHGELAAIVRACRNRAFDEGEIIVHQGDPGNGLFLVKSGVVKIALMAETGQETMVALMSAGDCFGELAVLDGRPRSANATAMEKAECLFLPRDEFLRFLEANPKAMMKIIILLSRRLRYTDEHVGDLVFFDVYSRIAKKLLELSESHGVNTKEGLQITLPLTQQDLADLVGSSRESVNKVMRQYRDKGYIAVANRRIVITDAKNLELRASIHQ